MVTLTCSASTAVVGALAPARRDLPQNRLRQLGINFGDDNITSAKVKGPTLAQNARMGHPNFNTQNLNIQTSKPKTPTPELQDPEFAIKRKAVSSYRMPRTARC